MSRIALALLAIVACGCISAVSAQATTRVAAATIRGTSAYPTITGQYIFTQAAAGDLVTIDVTLSGLPMSGLYASHVHKFGDINTDPISTNGTGTGVGAHFNPWNTVHDCFPNSTRHVGDMFRELNVSDSTMTFHEVFTRDLLELGGDSLASIIGRAVIVHSSYDRCLEQQPAGLAGTPWAQGVIGIVDASKAVYGGSTATNVASILLPAQPNSAIARIFPTTTGAGTLYPNITGTVQFGLNSVTGLVRVVANIAGLEPNTTHGIHVHQFGDDTGAGTNAGGHYNPAAATHALPPTNPRHMGDIGNLYVNLAGVGFLDMEFDLLVLTSMTNTSLDNIIGRGVIIHQLIDQGAPFASTNGAAGSRYAAGVIGVSNRMMPAVTVASSSSGTYNSASSTGGLVAAASATQTSIATLAAAIFAAVLVAARM